MSVVTHPDPSVCNRKTKLRTIVNPDGLIALLFFGGSMGRTAARREKAGQNFLFDLLFAPNCCPSLFSQLHSFRRSAAQQDNLSNGPLGSDEKGKGAPASCYPFPSILCTRNFAGKKGEARNPFPPAISSMTWITFAVSLYSCIIQRLLELFRAYAS